MAPSIAPSREPGAALRWIATVQLLAGLFAMHGLPMAGAATSSTMPSTMSSTMSMTATATTSPTTAVLAHPAQSTTAAAVMTGCDVADHCTATLRAGDGAPHPALVGVHALDVAASALHHVVTETVSARGPPPPDLQELCISRT